MSEWSTSELEGSATLDEAFRLFFTNEEQLPHTLWAPAERLNRAADEARPLAKRVRDLAEMSEQIDRLFRNYLAPLSIVGDQRPETAASWSVVLARWTEFLHHRSNRLLETVLLPELAVRGFRIVSVEDAMQACGEWIHCYFKEQIYPLLTPLAVDPGRPFPYISSDSLNLLVELHGVQQRGPAAKRARLKIPNITPRLIRLPFRSTTAGQDTVELIWSADLVRRHVDDLFIDMPIRLVHLFRVLRSGEPLAGDEPHVDDAYGRSARGSVVRVDVEADMPSRMLDWLVDHLDVISYSVVHFDKPGAGMSLPQLAQEVTAWSETADRQITLQ